MKEEATFLVIIFQVSVSLHKQYFFLNEQYILHGPRKETKDKRKKDCSIGKKESPTLHSPNTLNELTCKDR